MEHDPVKLEVLGIQMGKEDVANDVIGCPEEACWIKMDNMAKDTERDIKRGVYPTINVLKTDEDE